MIEVRADHSEVASGSQSRDEMPYSRMLSSSRDYPSRAPERNAIEGSEALIQWDEIGGAVESVETGSRADAITSLLAFARDAEPRSRFM